MQNALPDALRGQLEAVDSSIEKRWEVASFLIKNPLFLRDTLQYCYRPDNDLLIKASWVLEVVCQIEIESFLLYRHVFFNQLPHIKNDSALRSSAKICQILCYKDEVLPSFSTKILNKRERKIITECCFNWLLTDQKVACQASAMTCLLYLGSKKEWIYPELKNILIKNMSHKSAGYVARARQILKKLD